MYGLHTPIGVWRSRSSGHGDPVVARLGAGYRSAVFAALGEVISSKEIHDVESELPKEYAPLFSSVV